ncbi:MAG: hypothetical protein JXR63_03095 [Spirochaetales bacterium]|nr:hypothetical protein [Spirochaetales bacterium]
MKKLLSLFVSLVLVYGCSLPVALHEITGTETTKTYQQSEIESVYGVADNIVVYIHLPEGYSDSGTPYPAAFILDGDSLYKRGAAYNSELTEDYGKSGIVFGVGYGFSDAYANPTGNSGRWRDFTFPESLDFFTGEAVGEEKTNPDGYYKFLKEKLIPDMVAAYNIDADKIGLIGHSNGGDFAFYAFTQHNPASLADTGFANPFNYYIVVDGGQENYLQDVYEKAQKELMATKGNAFEKATHLYLIHGYLTSPSAVLLLESIAQKYIGYNYTNLTVNRFFPLRDDHGDAAYTGIRNGLMLLLGIDDYAKYADEGGVQL